MARISRANGRSVVAVTRQDTNEIHLFQGTDPARDPVDTLLVPGARCDAPHLLKLWPDGTLTLEPLIPASELPIDGGDGDDIPF
jgi:hypothetical protein